MFNPAEEIRVTEDTPTAYSIYEYDERSCESFQSESLKDCQPSGSGRLQWINVDGLRKSEVETLCRHFQIHPLLVEDILSKGQRAKADDMEVQLFALLPMLSYNEDTAMVSSEQLSLVIGSNFVLSFQPDPKRDPFNPIRQKLNKADSPIRKKGADYLAYSLIDAVVDDYFAVLEKLSTRLDNLEDLVFSRPNKSILFKLSLLRHEIMVMKRSMMPVRELINNFRNSDSLLIDPAIKKYFKDIYDHITLAIEYNENYREMVINLQELYMNQVNTRMNEVMKILTVVTTLLAPATVISSIYGMNFSQIPFSGSQHGFLVIVLIMLSFSALMLFIFKKKGWF
jgi:magnesium transporter